MTLSAQITSDIAGLVASGYGGTESLTFTTSGGVATTYAGWCKDPDVEIPIEIGSVVAERQLIAFVTVATMSTAPSAGTTVTRDGTAWKIYRCEKHDPWTWRLTLYIERKEHRIPGKAILR